MTTYELSSSAVVPAPPEQAYDLVIATPLEGLFGSRSGMIPPVLRTEDEDGAWGSRVGQSRTIVLGDGGRMLETLVDTDRPRTYGYRLSQIRGPMKPLVRGVEGRFAFTAEASGTRVTWSWRLHLTAPPVRLLMPVFGVFWRRSAQQAFARVAELA